MTITIARLPMVHARRASQKNRNCAIRKGSGNRLTACRLASALLGGNSGYGLLAAEREALDQPGHGQSLNEDRESDDDEGGEDDRSALGNGGRDCQRKRERERAAKAAPKKRVLKRCRNRPSGPVEKRRKRIDGKGAAREDEDDRRGCRSGSEQVERLGRDVAADEDEDDAVG